MKHSIPNTQNPYRMSLANHFVFYVQLKKLNSFIPTKINAILIIQSCGVFCFEGDEID